MPTTKDLGPFYGHTIKYPIKPKGIIERAYSQEIEGRFRKGLGIALRLPFTKLGIVLGIWKKTGYNESQALTSAIGGRGMKSDEEAWDVIRYGVLDECLEKETLQSDQNLK